MLLMIDNYDSFTFNLVQYFKELSQDVLTFRNDAITIDEIEKLNPDFIVLSPGPGRPENAGITMEVIKQFAGKIPILGICLGHQAIVQMYGGNIVHAKKVMHGKTSFIEHQQENLFSMIKSPLRATRYHSLIAETASFPNELEVTAFTLSENQQKEIMGLKHRVHAIYGLQFHPESILTEHGHQLLKNFLNSTASKTLLGLRDQVAG